MRRGLPTMRVLYLERNLAADALVTDQVRRVQSLGLDIRVVAVQTGRFPALRMPDATSVRCPFVPWSERAKSALFVRAALAGARRATVRGWQPDLIHAHFAYPDGVAARAVAGRLQVPYVVTARGDDLLIYPGRGRFLAGSVRHALDAAAAVVCVSRHLGGVAVGLGASPGTIRHIPDGVLGDLFNWRPDLEGQRRRRAVLFAGSFLPVKNVLRLCQACGAVAQAIPNASFRFAGEGPLRIRMQAALAACGVRNVTWLGQLPAPALADEMRQAAVLVLPSVSEGWGNVIAEAMACGTPVVGSRVGGIPEQVVSEDYGYLCDPNSPANIADKILLALNRHDWDRSKLAARGGVYTRDATARRLVEVYREVLAEGNPAAR